jgi:hypothetical protein
MHVPGTPIKMVHFLHLVIDRYVSGHLHAPADLYPEKEAPVLIEQVAPHSWSGYFEVVNLLVLEGIKPRFFGSPALSLVIRPTPTTTLRLRFKRRCFF